MRPHDVTTELTAEVCLQASENSALVKLLLVILKFVSGTSRAYNLTYLFSFKTGRPTSLTFSKCFKKRLVRNVQLQVGRFFL